MVAHNTGPKIQEEKKNVRAMIYLYCNKHHHSKFNQLCEECDDLLQFAMKRLTMCRFGEKKTTCERCPKHCYPKNYKHKIKQVMRFAGPRMIIHHPIMAFKHLYKNLMNKKHC